MAFYQRLKDLKEDADLTQKDVADIIGVSINHYGKYERGETDIPFEKALKLAEYYNVSLDYIAGRTNKKYNFNELPKDSSYFLALYNRLTSENKSRIEERMLEMLEKQK
ncbi:helix-turn-helix domain-containing protein [Porcipelethomonas sp.]|uniref:helix-turn-helix domain-containing protein n=1 Tax=Porcipelethomonas sp. TaxID=2981675 RepID=UPI003EF7D7D9